MKMFTKIVSILSVISLFAVAQANASGVAHNSGNVKKAPAAKAAVKKLNNAGSQTVDNGTGDNNDEVSTSMAPTPAVVVGVAAVAKAKAKEKKEDK